jgi:hypothetical protein
MIVRVGNFKYQITPKVDGDGFTSMELIVLSLQDPYFNTWRVEVIEQFNGVVAAEQSAKQIIKVLQQYEMMVEE